MIDFFFVDQKKVLNELNRTEQRKRFRKYSSKSNWFDLIDLIIIVVTSFLVLQSTRIVISSLISKVKNQFFKSKNLSTWGTQQQQGKNLTFDYCKIIIITLFQVCFFFWFLICVAEKRRRNWVKQQGNFVIFWKTLTLKSQTSNIKHQNIKHHHGTSLCNIICSPFGWSSY